jgi:hypothetical protein
MSIQGYVEELASIDLELKQLMARAKFLRGEKKKVMEYIQEFLQAKDQPGVKYKNIAIVREKKEVADKKTAKEKAIDAIIVLEKHGIQDAEKVLKEIREAEKGEKVVHEKIAVKKIKRKT